MSRHPWNLNAGGADAGAGAASSVYVGKKPVWFLERLTRKEVALRRGRFGICVLVQAPAVPVPKGPARGWRVGLQLMRGPCFVQGWLLRGETGASGGRSTLGKGVYTR